MRAGGLAALVAAYLASRIDEEKDVVLALQPDSMSDEIAESRGGRGSLTLPRRSSSSGGLLDYHRAG